jgi:hypothetical protein
MSAVQHKGRAVGAKRRLWRFLPSKRWQRVLIYLAIAIGYIALMWLYVFPWADRIVNRPTV